MFPVFLIYGFPIFAGVIGSRYLSRLGNFCVMVVVFEFDLAILFGQFTAAAFTPYTVVCIFPAVAGIVGDRYFGFGKIANALLNIGVFYVGGVLLAYHNRGKFIPLLFLQAIFVSAGSLVPPLVFILVAIVAYRLRRFAIL